MGDLLETKPVKLITSVIYKDHKLYQQAENILQEKYGAIEEASRDFDFDYTDYYEPEMGDELKRKLICFSELVDKEDISKVKLESNSVENLFKSKGKRQVNIDPGYITEAKLVLLTTKDYTHRIYVGMRIFAESTLYYMNGTFNPWPWTYPDYGTSEMVEYFNEVREIYMSDLKKRRLSKKQQ